MSGHILYYPTIEFQSDAWLKGALCVWDYVYRIVPPDYIAQDSDETKEAIDAGCIRDIKLTGADLSECADRFEEFWESAPMIPDGAQHVEQVRLFEGKVDARLLPVLKSVATKFTKEGELQLPKETADTYMLFLADIVARRRNIEKITDDADVFALMHYFANDGNFTDYLCDPEAAEASIAATLPAVLPGGLDHTAMRLVLDFRLRYEDSRIQFRDSISAFALELSKVDDEAHTRQLISDFSAELQRKNARGAENIKAEALNVVTSMMSIGVPAALSALGALVSTGQSIKDTATIVGTVAVGCVATIADATRSRRGLWKKDDTFYYVALNKRFEGGQLEMIVPKYDSILNEFVND